jgi:hypothetical protein
VGKDYAVDISTLVDIKLPQRRNEREGAMEYSALSFFRILIPGIMLFLFFMLLLTNDFNEIGNISILIRDFKLKDTFYIVVFLIVGAIYYIFKIRNILWKPFYIKVQNNIKNKLLSPVIDKLTAAQKKKLKEKRKLINIFYHFVDLDASLKEKAKRIRFNGLIWSSCVDLSTISSLTAIAFLIKYLITGTKYNIIVFLFLILLAVTAILFIVILTNRHISLSNEQLDMICQIYKRQLEEKIFEQLE